MFKAGRKITRRGCSNCNIVTFKEAEKVQEATCGCATYEFECPSCDMYIAFEELCRPCGDFRI